MSETIPDEQVRIRVSTCPKCGGWVRAAVIHMMPPKEMSEFMREVTKYGLSVNDEPLSVYRNTERQICQCP